MSADEKQLARIDKPLQDDALAFQMSSLELRSSSNSVFQELTNRQIPSNFLALVSESFGRKDDEERVVMSLEGGFARREPVDGAFNLKAAVQFIAGADPQQVTLLEQDELKALDARTKSPLWRAHTTAKLLSEFEIRPDLVVNQQDNTAEILGIARQNSTHSAQNWTLGLIGSSTDSIVTIDSDNVQMVNNLRTAADVHLKSTCIELDGMSLLGLMVNFRNLMNQEGSRNAFSSQQIVAILEMMIEDARRLFCRSAILSRMSTRFIIINSQNTRYGVDDGFMFRTLATSRSIRQMLELGAAFYDSLKASDQIKAKIRPKFLQMVILLLSLLNEEDRAAIQLYVEATYGIQADRPNLELAFMKVLPLESTNHTIFLRAVLRAYTNRDNTIRDYDDAWTWLMTTITDNGYILPGVLPDDIGKSNHHLTWMMKWNPKLVNTSVFNNLQYNGRHREINDVPSLELFQQYGQKEINVTLIDHETYIMTPEDLVDITSTKPRSYIIKPARSTDDVSDRLNLEEFHMNQIIPQLTRKINSITKIINQYLVQLGDKDSTFKKLGKTRPKFSYADIRSSGKLCKCVATIVSGHSRDLARVLAVTYKLDGRKIPKTDLERMMQSDVEKAKAVTRDVNQKLENFTNKKRLTPTMLEDFERVKRQLREVQELILIAESEMNSIREYSGDLDDEVVERVHDPTSDDTNVGDIWSNYRSCCGTDGRFCVQANRFRIDSLWWVGNMCELQLHGFPSQISVMPLGTVQKDDKDEMISIRDWIVLVGRLAMIVEEGEEESGKETLGKVICYMRISRLEMPKVSKRSKRQSGAARMENAILDHRLF